MEPNFQTSFIPKKPVIEKRATPARPVSVFVIGSIFILFAVLLTTGGLYFYRTTLTKSVAQMQNELVLAQNSFEPSAITQLQVLDKRLNASTQILNNHIDIDPIFNALSAITMESVQYTQFSYSFDSTSTPEVDIKMSGVASGYRSIALQSDLFAANKNLINPIFSNLALDTKGNVDFDLEFSVNPSFVNYKQVLSTQSS